ncbi:protein LEAD-SENSITIVE 1-like [Syzygium oleosum]|uniref:protein LEAD-SENSITIVE 1-like n=1 Tax=Syzygium oleosum TaxID=219896 RepID=UPI0011D24050|nr:protein LEAD-SENSITIVE 1-like [Syzygium oleosum]
MVMEIINKVLTLLMQLMWKVVRPEDLKPGDHIYRYGLYGLYSHHGIYIGDGYVIHYTQTESKTTIFPSLSKTGHKQEILPPCPECEYQEKNIKRGVVKTCLDCFRRDGKKLRSLRCYEYGRPLLGFMLTRRGTCTMLLYTKLPHQVVDTARQLHGNNGFGNYSLINNNCEHFATFCRTGIRASEQTAFVSYCERKIKEAKEWTMKLLKRN